MITKCENGHWYDMTVHKVCPHCKRNSEKVNMRIHDDVMEDDRTVAFSQTEAALDEELSTILKHSVNMENTPYSSGLNGDDDNTISFGFWGIVDTQPITGWLICINGDEKGKDYRLHTGKNFVGRSTSMDVVLAGDKKISRDKHCSIAYDPKSNHFYLSPENTNLTYLNRKLVNKAVEMNEEDIILIGNTELLFIPYCKGERKWEEE